MTPEMMWATARGFDLKAPHWDDLDPAIKTAITTVVELASDRVKHQSTCDLAPYLLGITAVRCTCGTLQHAPTPKVITDLRSDAPDDLKFDPGVVAALAPFLFADPGSPAGNVPSRFLRDLSLASYEAGRRASKDEPPKAVENSGGRAPQFTEGDRVEVFTQVGQKEGWHGTVIGRDRGGWKVQIDGHHEPTIHDHVNMRRLVPTA